MFSFRRLMLIAGIAYGISTAATAGTNPVSFPNPETRDTQLAPQRQYGPFNSYEAAFAKAEQIRAHGTYARVEKGHTYWYVYSDE